MRVQRLSSSSSERGFTLIEMLVVMALIALLLTIAVPRYFGSIDKSRDVALRENLRVIRVCLDKYYADNGRYPLSLDELVERRYLRAVPVDPITESSETWVEVLDLRGEIEGIADVRSGAPGIGRGGIPYEKM